MAGYRATPMQFQFLAVSGRAAGDASIRDQPPVKSRASSPPPTLPPPLPACPLSATHPETKPGLAFSLSLDTFIPLPLSLLPPPLSLCLSLSRVSRSPLLQLPPVPCLPLALIPVNRLQPPACHPRFPSNIESPFALSLSLSLSLSSPPLPFRPFPLC